MNQIEKSLVCSPPFCSSVPCNLTFHWLFLPGPILLNQLTITFYLFPSRPSRISWLSSPLFVQSSMSALLTQPPLLTPLIQPFQQFPFPFSIAFLAAEEFICTSVFMTLWTGDNQIDSSKPKLLAQVSDPHLQFLPFVAAYLRSTEARTGQ